MRKGTMGALVSGFVASCRRGVFVVAFALAALLALSAAGLSAGAREPGHAALSPHRSAARASERRAGEPCLDQGEEEDGLLGEHRVIDPLQMRAVVVIEGEDDPAILRQLRELGANTIATYSNPKRSTSQAARAAGLFYIAYVSTEDVERLESDRDFYEAVLAVEDLAGFHYLDESVEEGYTTPEIQKRTHDTLKRLFPGKVVLYPTRLDPVQTDPTYLERYFRPEFSDLLAPYFYPVGTTVLGMAREDESWELRLLSLLQPVAERMPQGKGVLPVLQAFEQIGFPVSRRLIERQMAVYQSLWPQNRNVVAFWWGGGVADPLIGLGEVSDLRVGVQKLFWALEAAGGQVRQLRRPCFSLMLARESPCAPTSGATRRRSPCRERVLGFRGISGMMMLLPGDLTLTGIPAGVGSPSVGDVFEVEIEKIGALRNRVVDSP